MTRIKNNWHLIVLVVMMLVVAVPFFVTDRQFPARADDTTRFIEQVQSGQYAGYFLKYLSVPIVKFAERAGYSPAQAFQWFDLVFRFSGLIFRFSGSTSHFQEAHQSRFLLDRPKDFGGIPSPFF